MAQLIGSMTNFPPVNYPPNNIKQTGSTNPKIPVNPNNKKEGGMYSKKADTTATSTL